MMRRTVITCPNYGKTYATGGFGGFSGSGTIHEYYRFSDNDADLHPLLRLHRVRDMSPNARAAFYSTVALAIVFGAIVLVSFLLFP